MSLYYRQKDKGTSFVFWLISNVLSPGNVDWGEKKSRGFFQQLKGKIQNVIFNF